MANVSGGRKCGQLKTIWDPDWKMNPGKWSTHTRSKKICGSAPTMLPWHAETFFKFPDDEGSFPRATLRCIGVGKCRRPEDALMCPSFLAFREETTRGRAHALFEMFRGDFTRNGWRSEKVREALELCLDL